ncbi:MAG TPA: Holliday junction resolvase RuvX, partial [Candidatus Eisenbacteria bacterium]|nr:Holliday junction resolvase RuvX [Candidatus Eisenbacteria bacterium]
NKGKTATLEALKKICSEHGVGEVVIGLPVNMNGTQGPKAKEILELVPQLEKSLGVPVTVWDERLSSAQANRLMTEGGLSSRRQRGAADRLAATLILQGFLESRRSSA